MTEIKNWLNRPVSIAPLVTFRITFGAIMLFSVLRFWFNGWIRTQYIDPHFYFTYMGFDWVKPLGMTGTYLLFLVMGTAAFLILIGLWYRLSIVLFFITFSYTELIDITNYLNHYYFISIVSFLLIFLPAGRSFAVDVYLKPERKCTCVPFWMVGVLRLQMGLVYFFAGLAKLNGDWMLEALPLKIWLPAKSHLPLIGPLMYKEWIAYAFSWLGACYDLFIVFFLLHKTTRPYAYIAVIGFHLFTALFFPAIGMFPYVMILSSLIFMDAGFHEYWLSFLTGKEYFKQGSAKAGGSIHVHYSLSVLLGLFFLLQVLIPFRYLRYPGPLFWYEEGYRFSWRVMLMEKSGNTFFYVKDPDTGRVFEVNNPDFLTAQQEKMMSTQPDMILRYAHYLKKIYQERHILRPEVYAEGYVALNGRRSKAFIDPNINLAAQELSWRHVNFILPFSN
ncbi:HTTM domain-containing protein [Pedobacter sp. AW31-3R]|uniref:HTTM domain-containing protein n=1 Tax=Pedobacter sp. AW31-3R TaxID=3445781 RepID=UPI003F9F98CE